jgi:hypothetical protein
MVKIVEKNLIKIGKEPVVILPLKEYKKLLKYELEKEYIDEIVKEGLKEKKEGKTESLESFLKREYPKLYENYTR